jgi:hypothetical protein
MARDSTGTFLSRAMFRRLLQTLAAGGAPVDSSSDDDGAEASDSVGEDEV